MSMTSGVKPRGDTSFIYSVSDQSKETLIGDSPTAMVYGFQHCKYTQIQDGLKNVLERVYDCSLGNDLVPGNSDNHKRLSGEKIHKVHSGVHELDSSNERRFQTQDCNRKCKSGLVNLVLDNYIRLKEGHQTLTPIIFSVDIEGNPYPLTSENLLSKTKTVQNGSFSLKMNRIVTHSELRRAYKLCHDPKVDTEIRAIAKKTFKFVKVGENRTERDIEKTDKIDREISVIFTLTEIPAPWEKLDFATEFKKRQTFSANKIHPIKTQDWRAQVNQVPIDQRAKTLSKILTEALVDHRAKVLSKILTETLEKIM